MPRRKTPIAGSAYGYDLHPGRSRSCASFRNRSRREAAVEGAAAARAINRRRFRSARKKSYPPRSSSRVTRLDAAAGCRHRQAVVAIADHFARPGGDAFRPFAGPRADRRSEGHQRIPEGYGGGVGGHGTGRAATAAAEMEGCDSERAEGPAVPAARRSHFPAIEVALGATAAGRRRRGWRGARSGGPFRSGTRYREESIRDPESAATARSRRRRRSTMR